MSSNTQPVFNSGVGPGPLYVSLTVSVLSCYCYETVNKMVFSKFNKHDFESNENVVITDCSRLSSSGSCLNVVNQTKHLQHAHTG